MKKYVFTIEHADNGYILKEGAQDPENPSVLVGVEESASTTEAQCFRDFLYAITEKFGPTWSKWNAENVVIRIDPGEDTEGLSFDEHYMAENILDMKQELSWEEYGKKVFKKLTEDRDDDLKFRIDNKLPGHYDT